MYVGELALGRVLADSTAELRRVRCAVVRYPAALARAATERGLAEADVALETVAKGVARGDVAYVAGSLYRCVACLVQALFAMNRRYVVNKKNSVTAAAALPLAPPGFEDEVSAVLGKTGVMTGELGRAIERTRALIEAIRAIA